MYTIAKKLEQFAKATVDYTLSYGKADEHFNLDDYTRFPVMEEVMREYVPGVLVRKKRWILTSLYSTM